MSTSALVLHKGGRLVTLDELNAVEAPPPEGRWFPLAHRTVLTRVKETLGEAGYVVKREQFGLAKADARFFGTLDLSTPLSEGVTLSVGIRNSTDKSFPIGFAAGSRVFCCDNLSFSGELMVRRKHTKNGELRFGHDVASTVVRLGQFKADETRRIAAMKVTEISDVQADSLILNAYYRGIATTPYLQKIIQCWRNPEHEEFKARTLWSLANAFTSAMGDKAKANPSAYAITTMRLTGFLSPHATFALAA
jgi:hypothetical protein